jgi:hypothetical protein
LAGCARGRPDGARASLRSAGRLRRIAPLRRRRPAAKRPSVAGCARGRPDGARASLRSAGRLRRIAPSAAGGPPRSGPPRSGPPPQAALLLAQRDHRIHARRAQRRQHRGDQT